MSRSFVLALVVFVFGAGALPCRADSWTSPGCDSCAAPASPAPDCGCGCENGGHHGFLKGWHHAHECCAVESSSPCGCGSGCASASPCACNSSYAPACDCGAPCGCEAPHHKLFGFLHHKRGCEAEACGCAAPAEPCGCAAPAEPCGCEKKHHLFGFLHHNKECCVPACDCGTPACSSCQH